nr:APC family permease [Chloroflexia bacterium]
MAERRPKHQGLERVLGTGALFSTAYGNVGSSIYYALGLVAALALGLTPVVFVIAGLIFAATAATYAEGTTMYPEAGGASSFARRAFNEFWSFFTAWGQMLTYIITVAISAFFVPHYLGVFWEPLGESPADVIAGIGVVAVLAAINVVGVKESAGLNIFLALADFLTQLLLVAVGVVLVLSPETLVSQVDLGTAPTVRDFLIAIPVAMVAYTGIETVSNLAEEARDYERTIPRGIGGVVAAVAAIYAFLPAIALSALPVRDGQTALGLPKEEGGFADDPVLGVVRNLDLPPALAGPAEIYVGVLAATILFIATNAGLIGVSRLTYSMGQHRQLPERLRRLHPRFRTPHVAIAAFALVACLAIVPGQADFLGTIYAFGAMLGFTMAHVSVVRLRLLQPRHERPFRGPGNLRIGDRDIPLFAVFGGLGTGIAFVVVTVLDVRVLVSGLVWMAIGIAGYAVYRRSQRLSLTQTAKIVVPKPIVEHEVEYESILVVVEDDAYHPEDVSTAFKLAAHRSRGIH